MSTNCLVTKLKGTVNNDNLEILGEKNINIGITSIPQKTNLGNICFVFDVPSYVIPNRSILYKTDTYASATKVFNVSENETIDIPVAPSGEAKITTVGSATGGILVIRPTDMNDIRFRVGNIYDVSGIGTHYCSARKSEFLKLLKSTKNIKYFTLRDTTLDSILSLDELLDNISKPEDLKIIAFENSNVEGDVSQMGVFVNSEWFTITGTNITGSIESLVESLIENEKPDKNFFEINATPAKVTLNGEPLPVPKIYVTFSQGTATVYSTNKTTVLASYNGTSWSYPS